MESLKKLISVDEASPWLYNGSAKKWEHLKDLKNDNHVVLFVSNLDITEDIFQKMNAIHNGTVMTRAVTIWLPIEKWTDERERKLIWRRDSMPWYTVWYFSQIAGLKNIKEEWSFVGTPLVVVMDPQGCVLSKYELNQLPKFSKLGAAEKAVALRTKRLLQKPSGKIRDVLEALFGYDNLRHLDGKNKKQVKVSNLQDNYVLFFIWGLDMDYYAIEQIKAVYAGIAKDRVKMVLIPMGKGKTEELPQKLELQSDRNCYTVKGHLPESCINFIRNDWYFRNSPVVVMMNPHGEVLSKYKFNLEPMVPLALPNEIYVYSLHWGGRYSYWNERFLQIARAVAADKVLEAAKTRIDLPSKDAMQMDHRTKWALLMRNQGPESIKICEGPKMLNVLEAFNKWKVNLTLAPFERCFIDYFNELS